MTSIPNLEVNFIKNHYSSIPTLQFKKYPNVQIQLPIDYPQDALLKSPDKFIKINLTDENGSFAAETKITDVANTLQIKKQYIKDAKSQNQLQLLLDTIIACRHYEISFGSKDLTSSLSKAEEEISTAKKASEKTAALFRSLQIDKECFVKIQHGRVIELDLIYKPSLEKSLNIYFRSVDGASPAPLFFKLIGRGAYSSVVQRVNLSDGVLETGKNSVIKIPNSGPNDPKIENEIMILNEICKNGLVLGIRSPVIKADCDLLGHMGDFYQMDLKHFLGNSSKAFKQYAPEKLLTKFEKTSLAYQLVSGLKFLHKKRISHGDIKAANVFLKYNMNSKADELHTFVYYADFGDAYIHKNEPLPKGRSCTVLYKCASDILESHRIAKEENNALKYEAHQKACDVFATAAVIYEIFTQRSYGEFPKFPYGDSHPWMPYYMDSPKFNPELRSDLKNRLIKGGASHALSDCLFTSLDFNYSRRPFSGKLKSILKKDLKEVDSVKAKSIYKG